MQSIAHMTAPPTSTLNQGLKILKVMQGAVAQFARQAEARVSTPGCMTAWQSEVDVKIAERVSQIPDGTLLTLHEALPYLGPKTCQSIQHVVKTEDFSRKHKAQTLQGQIVSAETCQQCGPGLVLLSSLLHAWRSYLDCGEQH